MKRARPYDRDVALEAAMTLFWEKGYHATSLKDLETALQMKPGSIYSAFLSKENLFGLVLERYFERNRAEFVSMMESEESPLLALAKFLRRFGRSEQSNPKGQACMLIKTLLNATQDDAAITEKVTTYLDLMEREMAAVFARAVKAGELPQNADVQRLARRYQSDLTALRIEAHRGLKPHELEASANEVADNLLAQRLQ